MAKTVDTLQLEHNILQATKNLSVFQCFEVTIGIGGNERVDFMTYDNKGVWRCYELKSSVADFRSKAALSFYGHYNYFVLTREVYEKVGNEIPDYIGIYVGNRLVKRAKKRQLTIPDETLKLSFIRSLSRDANKYRFNTNAYTVQLHQEHNKELVQLRKEAESYKFFYQETEKLLNKAFGQNWYDEINRIIEQKNDIKGMPLPKLKI